MFIQTDHENMDEIWADFKSSIQKIIEKGVPTKMASARHSHSWINCSIKRAIRRKVEVDSLNERQRLIQNSSSNRSSGRLVDQLANMHFISTSVLRSYSIRRREF